MILRLTETANARDTSISIWSMYALIKRNILAARTFEQCQHCEVMVNKLILERYAHMPLTSHLLAKWLRGTIQKVERAIFFDNLNTEI